MTTTLTRSHVVRPSTFRPRLTGATAARVLRQLRHDHRTMAMLLLVPSLLLSRSGPAGTHPVQAGGSA